MDILQHILELRRERKWTEYELAERSGLTQSTISSWYKKNMLPSIPSLTKICDAFGLTLSEFFLEHQQDGDDKIMVTIDRQKYELIQEASRLEDDQFKALMQLLRTL